jgi:hypothetical protein
MTESDIGSGSHREPSSATLDIAKLKERHIALRSDVSDMRDTMSDIKGLLIGHIQNSDSRHAQLLATFNQHNLEDAVVHTKVGQIDEHLKNTDMNVAALVETINNDKRSPVAIILAVLASLAAGATAWFK